MCLYGFLLQPLECIVLPNGNNHHVPLLSFAKVLYLILIYGSE